MQRSWRFVFISCVMWIRVWYETVSDSAATLRAVQIRQMSSTVSHVGPSWNAPREMILSSGSPNAKLHVSSKYLDCHRTTVLIQDGTDGNQLICYHWWQLISNKWQQAQYEIRDITTVSAMYHILASWWHSQVLLASWQPDPTFSLSHTLSSESLAQIKLHILAKTSEEKHCNFGMGLKSVCNFLLLQFYVLKFSNSTPSKVSSFFT